MEQPVGRLISAIHRKIHQRVAAELKDFDIDIGQFFFLLYISKHDGISQDQMAQNLYLDKTTASKGIKRLMEIGCVERKVNPCDRRQFQLCTTKKGKDLSPELNKIYMSTQEFIVQNLSEDEKDCLNRVLQKMIQNFDD